MYMYLDRTKNLKQAVDQWKIYPKIVHIHDLFDQQTISKYLAEILVHVFHINGMFSHILDLILNNI